MLSGICGERELMQYGERKERSARAEGCPVRREDDLGVRVKERGAQEGGLGFSYLMITVLRNPYPSYCAGF